jgi:DNA-binding XRE family transcriptional regulator
MTDKQRRTMVRYTRLKLNVTRSELAALAGVNLETIIQYETCKEISRENDSHIGNAIIRLVMERNPEATKKAVQPFLKEAEKWEKIHSVEPGTELAAQLEKLNGKTLAEMKTQAEGVGIFRRAMSSWIK